MGMSACYRSVDECRAKMAASPGSFDDADCWSAPAAWCVVDDVMTTCYAEEAECHEAEAYIAEDGGAVVQPCAWND
jgi:hypothetical protein